MLILKLMEVFQVKDLAKCAISWLYMLKKVIFTQKESFITFWPFKVQISKSNISPQLKKKIICKLSLIMSQIYFDFTKMLKTDVSKQYYRF